MISTLHRRNLVHLPHVNFETSFTLYWMKHFETKVNGWKQPTIDSKNYVLDVTQVLYPPLVFSMFSKESFSSFAFNSERVEAN